MQIDRERGAAVHQEPGKQTRGALKNVGGRDDCELRRLFLLNCESFARGCRISLFSNDADLKKNAYAP